MKAPYRASPPKNNHVRVLICNSDPKKLDEVYVRFLGRGGDKLLSEESKWLAVTAKSFDHGRRGFNDRLAFFGKRIVELQCSLGLLNARDSSKHHLKDHPSSHGREPFSHPATDAIEVLSGGARHWFTHHKQLSTIAQRNGFPEVVRWHPKYQDNLEASGSDLVYSQALMAVIGALALEQGSAVANRIAREKILFPLGLKEATNEKLEVPQR
ncbi:hypothetical protein LTR84_012200 [Exophiala bonariae]|uniref:RNase III domain-containing protein n=1 Tax=Exophiala bonariae TaxID=1690606 RepID=A0AAV9NFV2_9EURO|nr:hypothetical protein LTR84_012200 [Exophiala bonariae]